MFTSYYGRNSQVSKDNGNTVKVLFLVIWFKIIILPFLTCPSSSFYGPNPDLLTFWVNVLRSNSRLLPHLRFYLFSYSFERGFLCLALAVLEFTLSACLCLRVLTFKAYTTTPSLSCHFFLILEMDLVRLPRTLAQNSWIQESSYLGFQSS